MITIIKHSDYIKDKKFGDIILKCTKKVIKLYKKLCPTRYEYTLKRLEKSILNIEYDFEATDWYALYFSIEEKREDKIIYSHKMLKNCSEDEIYLIVAHEMAHLFDVYIRGSKCPMHDKHWKNLTLLLNGADKAIIDLSKN